MFTPVDKDEREAEETEADWSANIPQLVVGKVEVHNNHLHCPQSAVERVKTLIQ
jgi:hypothetical protein